MIYPDRAILCAPHDLTKHPTTANRICPMWLRSRRPRIRAPADHLIILGSITYRRGQKRSTWQIFVENALLPGGNISWHFRPSHPGNTTFETSTVPKMVGASDLQALEFAALSHRSLVKQTMLSRIAYTHGSAPA